MLIAQAATSGRPLARTFSAGTSNDKTFASTGPRGRDRHTQNGKKVERPRRAVMSLGRAVYDRAWSLTMAVVSENLWSA